MEITINKIEDGHIHLHDASNYVREALTTNHERAVTTSVADFMLHITVRTKGSLDGYTSSIPLLDNYTDRVKPHDLKVAVEMLKSAFGPRHPLFPDVIFKTPALKELLDDKAEQAERQSKRQVEAARIAQERYGLMEQGQI